jgi:hypothetical protein
MDKKPVTVGPKEGLGAGIFAVGLILAFLPSTSQSIADIVQGSTPYAILTGAVLVFAFITMLAGLAVIFSKFDD